MNQTLSKGQRKYKLHSLLYTPGYLVLVYNAFFCLGTIFSQVISVIQKSFSYHALAWCNVFIIKGTINTIGEIFIFCTKFCTRLLQSRKGLWSVNKFPSRRLRSTRTHNCRHHISLHKLQRDKASNSQSEVQNKI